MIKPLLCEIKMNKNIGTGLYKMVITALEIAKATLPGQFIHMKIPNDESLLLRRPISVCDVRDDDIEIIYQVTGKGTDAMSQCLVGSKIDVLGPLGQGFYLPDGAKKLWLIGGGIGLAPLYLAAKKWNNIDVKCFTGFRSKCFSYKIKDFDDICSLGIETATDDGSLGHHCFVTQLVTEALSNDIPDIIMSCGPLPMLKAVKKIAADNDISCQLSLEERMGCGMGACLTCSCTAKNDDVDDVDWIYKRVCADGPVFDAEEVNLNG